MREILKPESNRYQLSVKIGEGLSSCVYKATRLDSRCLSAQQVAIKLLKSQGHLDLLVQEFETLSRVRSPHCVSVLAWENFRSGSALVLDYVDGVNFAELTQKASISSAILDELTRQIQLGLRHLAEQNLCHGDLSPTNILIDQTGQVRLVDFGLARGDGGQYFGTPGFLAPERWHGGAVSFAADLYALGLLRKAVDAEADVGILVALDPGARRPMRIDENPRAQKDLAEIVQRLVRERETEVPITQVMAVRPRSAEISPFKGFIWNQRLPVMQSAILLLLTSVLLAPVHWTHLGAGRSPTSALEIRSREWLHAKLNNKSIGYAPLRLSDLPPGVYELYWQSARQSGTLKLTLRSGDYKLLTDADFAAASK